MAADQRIFRLACQPNNFPWGKVGKDSLVAQFAPNGCVPDFKVEDSEPYSELWMGSHPTNPASLYPDGPLLSAHLAKCPELLGTAQRFPAPFTGASKKGAEGGHVPFLFKILCCKQALPLQIHPNKDLAAKLHKEDPEQFPDTNHKPEIAVCLSDRFLGFAHFRPLAEIQSLLSAIPEFADSSVPAPVCSAISSFAASCSQDDLRTAWTCLLDPKHKSVLESLVSKLAARVHSEGDAAWKALQGEVWTERVRANLTEAVGLMEKYYPGDPSTLAVIPFMNLVELKKGEGMYVGADGLHAWLQGDIVELMAISDNVLNVGFTDPAEISASLPTVTRALTFQGVDPGSIALARKPYAKGKKRGTTVYVVPFEEFNILHIGGEEEMEAFTGPAIGVVTTHEAVVVAEKGKTGTRYERGSVFFVAANTAFTTQGSGEVWMAFYDGE